MLFLLPGGEGQDEGERRYRSLRQFLDFRVELVQRKAFRNDPVAGVGQDQPGQGCDVRSPPGFFGLFRDPPDGERNRAGGFPCVEDFIAGDCRLHADDKNIFLPERRRLFIQLADDVAGWPLVGVEEAQQHRLVRRHGVGDQIHGSQAGQ
jgi:hypothetical protein